MKRYLPFVIIGAVLVLALGAGALMFRSSQSQSQSPTPTPALASASPQGAPAAKGIVTVEEFGDYQCPPCGMVHPMLKKLKSEFGPRVRFIFYHLPLTQVHKNALDAAHAAVAASLQGRFWEMHDLLYDNQKEWAEAPNLRPYAVGFASQLGLDVARFTRDMDSPQVDAKVQADIQSAASRGVNATPTIFIDGQMFDNDKMSLENLRKEVAQKLGVR
jgi:protein-disulfide isomerase